MNIQLTNAIIVEWASYLKGARPSADTAVYSLYHEGRGSSSLDYNGSRITVWRSTWNNIKQLSLKHEKYDQIEWGYCSPTLFSDDVTTPARHSSLNCYTTIPGACHPGLMWWRHNASSPFLPQLMHNNTGRLPSPPNGMKSWNLENLYFFGLSRCAKRSLKWPYASLLLSSFRRLQCVAPKTVYS